MRRPRRISEMTNPGDEGVAATQRVSKRAERKQERKNHRTNGERRREFAATLRRKRTQSRRQYRQRRNQPEVFNNPSHYFKVMSSFGRRVFSKIIEEPLINFESFDGL